MHALKTIATPRSRSALRLVAAALLATLMAGCQSQVAKNAAAAYPSDYRERHPITLKNGDRSVEVFVGHNRGGLLPNQRADVLAFAQLWRRDSTSGIVIEVPRGGATARAAGDSLREVHAILAASGVPRSAVFVRDTRGGGLTTLASIKLSFTQLTATTAPCGRWPQDLGANVDSNDFTNLPYFNLGCASQRNLAAMIDNPADLVQPRGEPPAYANRRSTVIDKYRKGDNPGGTYDKYENGKITDFGK